MSVLVLLIKHVSNVAPHLSFPLWLVHFPCAPVSNKALLRPGVGSGAAQ